MIMEFLSFAVISMTIISTAFAEPSIYYSTEVNASSQFPNLSPTDAVTVTTDKQSYNDGDKIVISGSTRDHLTGTSVTIMIRNPVGNLIKVDQIDLASGGLYSTTMTAGGTLMQVAGVYQILVQYGDKDKTAQTMFVFTGPAGGNFMKVDGTDFTVSYSIANGAVLKIKAEPISKLLRVSILTTGNGALTIVLPRNLVDSKENGSDGKFLVSQNGIQTVFQETNNTTTDRTLLIPFSSETSEIDIIGTFVIPEFGQAMTLTLVMGAISVIALSRCRFSRLNIL